MKSEKAVKSEVRLGAARLGLQLWCNNVGAYTDADGRLVRYGLANESSQSNKEIKSSDLIGVLPMVVQPSHVGQTIGRFVAIETKHEGWHMTPGDNHARAQLRFIELVREAGGLAGFATSFSDLVSVLHFFSNIHDTRR